MQKITETSSFPDGIRPLHGDELESISGGNSLLLGGWVGGWFYLGYKIRTWLF